jgi:thiol-disulfide isomerase/thioredoxin
MPLKSLPSTVVALWLVVFPALAPGGELLHDRENRPTPALELPDLAGKQHRLGDYQGRVVLVNFWASWCPPCLAEMPSMQRLANALKGRPFTILAVNLEESKSTVWKFRKLLNIDFATLLDSTGDVTRAWGVEVFPTSYVIDSEGRARYFAEGPLEWDAAAVINAIEPLLPDHGAGTTAASESASSPQVTGPLRVP